MRALLSDNDSKQPVYESDIKAEVTRFWNPSSDLVPLLGASPWDGHIYVSGATNAGKTWTIKNILLNDQKKRPVVLFTDLTKSDPSLKGVNYTKYEGNDPFKDEIEGKLQNSKCIMVFDDVQYNEPVLKYRDHMLEKGRHMGVVVICVNHKLRGYRKTEVPLNDCKWIICYPNSNKGTCANFLRDDFGWDRKKSEEVTKLLASEGRPMFIHRFSPNFVAGTKTIVRA